MPQASPHILVAYKTVGRFDGCSQSVLWFEMEICYSMQYGGNLRTVN